jgi:hypothetical protein
MLADVKPTEHGTPRRRWWLWLVAVIVGIVLLIAGGFWMDNYLAEKAWADACAEADRLDPGWRWDDLMAARPIPPDDRNISVHIAAIRATLPQPWPDWLAAVRPEDVPPPPPVSAAPGGEDAFVPGSPEEARADYARKLEPGIDELGPNQQLRPAEAAALRIVLGSAAKALENAANIEVLPAGRRSRERAHPLDIFSDSVQHIRQVSQLLKWRATLLLQYGEADAALADCRRMLSVARAANAEPVFINALVAMAIRAVAVGRVERVLAQGEPGPAALEKTQRALENTLAEPLLLDMLRGERAWYEDLVQSVDAGLLDNTKAFDDPGVPSVTGIAAIDRILHRFRGGRWSKRDSAAQLRYLNLLLEIAKPSPDALRIRSPEVAAYWSGLPARVQKSTQTYDSLFGAERRSRALLNAAIAALAAERFRRDQGRFPASLDELVVANLLAAVPADPFDGNPLRFRQLADGLVIYSVGQDLIDDGGEISSNPTNPRFLKDVGVRLWDPVHRRQPAPPPGP